MCQTLNHLQIRSAIFFTQLLRAHPPVSAVPEPILPEHPKAPVQEELVRPVHIPFTPSHALSLAYVCRLMHIEEEE